MSTNKASLLDLVMLGLETRHEKLAAWWNPVPALKSLFKYTWAPTAGMAADKYQDKVLPESISKYIPSGSFTTLGAMHSANTKLHGMAGKPGWSGAAARKVPAMLNTVGLVGAPMLGAYSGGRAVQENNEQTADKLHGYEDTTRKTLELLDPNNPAQLKQIQQAVADGILPQSALTKATPVPQPPAVSPPKPDATQPAASSFDINNMPNWAKGLGVLAGAGGLGYLGNKMTEDEDEEGREVNKAPWLGPLLGAGAAAGGLGYLSNWDYKKLIDPTWLGINKTSSALILLPYHDTTITKSAQLPPPPPGALVPDAFKTIPPIQPPPQPPQPEQPLLPPPPAPKPTPQMPPSPQYAAYDTSNKLNTWAGEQQDYALNQRFNAATQGPPDPTKSQAPNSSMMNYFKNMPQENQQQGYEGMREYAPQKTQDYLAATGMKPQEEVENQYGSSGYPDEAFAQSAMPGTKTLPQGTLALLAAKAQATDPQLQNKEYVAAQSQQKIRDELVASGASANQPGFFDKVMSIWRELSPMHQILLAGGLGLGALGLLGTLTGSESFGGLPGALLGLGGLATAGYATGAFDSTSNLRKMFTGDWDKERQQTAMQAQDAKLPQVLPPISTVDPGMLSSQKIDPARLMELQQAVQAGKDPFNPTGPPVGQDAAQAILAHWLAGHTPDAKKVIGEMTASQPALSQFMQQQYGNVDPYMKEFYNPNKTQADQMFGGGQVGDLSQNGAGPSAATPPSATPPVEPATPTDWTSLSQQVPAISQYANIVNGKPVVTIDSLAKLESAIQTEGPKLLEQMAAIPPAGRAELLQAAIAAVDNATKQTGISAIADKAKIAYMGGRDKLVAEITASFDKVNKQLLARGQ